ncbi:hypothetical protein K9L16_04090 [Candidatus Pacearchaeota archaeon]|nr:hypothetical protein [Candidatus Pacearchaeota archaeon]
MSSLPGYTLEDFIKWNLNILVKDQLDANFNIGLSESLELVEHNRSILTEDQFKQIISIFEKYRKSVEQKLDDFKEDEQSWRDYTGYNFEFIKDDCYNKTEELLNEFKKEN